MLELQELATVFTGLSARESKDGSARLMRLADLTDLKEGRPLTMVKVEPPAVARALPIEDNDLIVAARGNSTEVCAASECILGAYISLDLYLVRPQSKLVNSEYLRAVLELSTTQAALSSEKQGSGLARLPKDALERITIPLPSIHQQRLIAKLACTLEDEQKLLKRLGETRACFGREILNRAIKVAEEKN